jgi:hypothetical protein
MHTGSTIVSEKIPASGAVRWRLQTWLRIDSGAKPEIYRQVVETTEINSLSYWLPADLGEIPLKAVLQSLRTRLGIPNLILNAERISSPDAAKSGESSQKAKRP